MNKKAHILLSISSCAFLLCSCNLLDILSHKHRFVLVNEKEASFYDDGVKEHYVCAGCKKTFDLDKNEKNPSEFLTRIPLFDILDRKNPISLKGKEIQLTFNENDVQNNIEAAKTLANKIDAGNYYSAQEVQNWANANNSLQKSTKTNYYYADVLADFEADSEGYETKNKIYNAFYDLQDAYYTVFVAVAKEGRYNYIFFASKTQKEIDDFIAKNSPSSGGGGGGTPSISQQMENVLNKYKSGALERYSAYSQYVALAKQYAQNKNKASYLDYAYESFGREYSVSQADSFSGFVKSYIKPLAETFRTKLTDSKQDEKTVNGLTDLNSDFFGKNMNLLRNYAVNLGNPYKNNFQKFFEEGHYFFSDKVNKNVTGYTTSSPDLGRYVFLSAGSQSLMSLTHEFGHYNAQENFGSSSDIDLSEIQSNGNEILLLSFMKKNSDLEDNVIKAFTYQQLSSTANTILLGCAINEFEKYVYNNDFDQQTMEGKWLELVDEYGASIGRNKLDYLYQVVLNYRGYYISYAVSNVAALSLYQKGIENFNAAAQSYKSIYSKDSDNEKFKASLTNAGLSDVFEANTYLKLSQLNNI